MALRLEAITLRGVGSYVHGSRLEVRPLTILSGVNGSGKSTWFKALAMLERSAEKRLLPFAFDDSSAYNVQFMNYSLYCRSDLSALTGGDQEARYGPPACVGLEFTVTQDLSFDGNAPANSQHLQASERLIRDGVCPTGTKLQVKLAHPTSDADSHIRKVTPGMYHLVELTIDGTTFSFQKPHNPNGNNATPSDYGLFRTSLQSIAIDETELRQLVAKRIQQIVQAFFEGYFHISAVRSLPDTIDFSASETPDDAHARRAVESNGQKSPEVFIWNCQKGNPRNLAAADGHLIFDGLEAHVNKSIDGLLETSLSAEWDEGEFNRFKNAYLDGPQVPKQLSSGFHQLFPIVVQLGVMLPGELLSVENPEVHLHPDLQLKVSEFLLQQSRSGRRIMIETHSDLIIRRIVRAILDEEDALSQQRVSLNFSTPQKDANGRIGSVLQQFGVDSGGRIEWPEGFMDASINESQRMMDVMYGYRRSTPSGDE
jgi:energy-coupling factor transporter ATP-binding protein EcfA2